MEDMNMTRAQELAGLDSSARRQLLRFVASLAWSDLAITAGERAYVHRLVSRLHLPPEEDVDPTTIPHEHRRLFLDTLREMVESDGGVSPEEKETLALLEQLTR
jgi:uncharacterized tellurite resistance protein B-like protein